MPIKVKEWSQALKIELADCGAPVAPVYHLGMGKWAQCPLCGCIHDVTSFKGQDYTPACVTIPRLYANHRREWLKAHQQTTGLTRVWLVELVETPAERMVA